MCGAGAQAPTQPFFPHAASMRVSFWRYCATTTVHTIDATSQPDSKNEWRLPYIIIYNHMYNILLYSFTSKHTVISDSFIPFAS